MDFSKVKNLAIPEGKVKSLSINDVVVWKKTEEPPVFDDRFCFYNPGDAVNKLYMKQQNPESSPHLTFQASADGKIWNDIDIYSGVEIQPKQLLFLRGSNERTNSAGGGNWNSFRSTQPIECHGNISNLCNGTHIPNKFRQLFSGMETLLTIPTLDYTNLTTRNDYAVYENTFTRCTSLTEVLIPNLQLLGDNEVCYGMFVGCTNLNKITVETTKWGKGADFGNWLSNVSPTGTFIKPKELQIGTGAWQIPENSNNGIPSGWTVENV